MQSMIRLYQYPAVWGLPNASPFCLKLELYLLMARIPYETVTCLNPAKSPKGKLPFIDDGKIRLSDSGLIIEYLKSQYGDSLDKRLSPAEKAQGIAFRRLIEENLYWAVVYSRWIDEKGWNITAPAFFAGIPAPLRILIAGMVRRKIRKQLWGHGLGRHSRNEIYNSGMTDLSALSDFLGDKSYFLGEFPTSFDASVYGMLANVLWTPIKSPLKEWLLKHQNLISYCQTIRDRYFLNGQSKRQLALGFDEDTDAA